MPWDGRISGDEIFEFVLEKNDPGFKIMRKTLLSGFVISLFVGGLVFAKSANTKRAKIGFGAAFGVSALGFQIYYSMEAEAKRAQARREQSE